MTEPALVERILRFWFGDQAQGNAPIEKVRLWFAREEAGSDYSNAARYVERHFLLQIKSAAIGGLADWQEGARSGLALILLLEQFPRLLTNGRPSTAGHRRYALRYCKAGMRAGVEEGLSPVELCTFYSPLVFSLNTAERQRGIRLLERLLEQTSASDHANHAQTGLVRRSLFMAVEYDTAERRNAAAMRIRA